MKIKDFGGGLNTFDAQINIADNQCASLVNVAYEEGDALRSRYGFTRTRSVTNVRGLYNWYKNDTLHQIYTTTGGLYDNGTLVTASFTGAFHAAEYATMVYLANGTYNKRYDGTTLYNWGVDAPAAPTVAASESSAATIDDMEDAPLCRAVTDINSSASVWQFSSGLGVFAAWNEGTHDRCASGTQASQVYGGSKSLQLVVSENGLVTVRKYLTPGVKTDLSTTSDEEYIWAYVKTPRPDDISSFHMNFYCASGTSAGYFSTPRTSPGRYHESKLSRSYGEDTLETTETGLSTVYFPYAPSEWARFGVPKKDMVGAGVLQDWRYITYIQLYVQTKEDTSGASLQIFVDNMIKSGVGSGLYGDFYFVGQYYNSTRDEYFGVSAESDKITLDVQGAQVTGIPATFDDQADQYKLWARRETGTKWYLVDTIDEGTTSTTVSTNNTQLEYNDELTALTGIFPANVTENGISYTRLGSNNLPPPTASNIIMHRNKMFFAVDDKIYHSKPLAPWAVPAGHYIVATSDADDVQAFYSDGMDLTVFSKIGDFSYLMAGEYDSQNIYQGTFIEARDFKRGCVAPHTVSDGIYASSQGLCYWDGQQGQILTKRIRPTYRGISGKGNLHGVVWEDLYLLVNPSGDSIVCEQYDTAQGKGVRFYLWSFSSTARCCAVDRVSNILYVGTDTGIYKYNTSAYTDTEGNFQMKALLKEYEYAPEDEEEPVQRFTVHSNTGGNSVLTGVFVDGVSHGSETINTTSRKETEAFTDLGSLGSFLQPRFLATVNQSNPVRIYGIEIS